MFADDEQPASEPHRWQIGLPLLRKSDHNRDIHLGNNRAYTSPSSLEALAHTNTNATLSIRFPILWSTRMAACASLLEVNLKERKEVHFFVILFLTFPLMVSMRQSRSTFPLPQSRLAECVCT